MGTILVFLMKTSIAMLALYLVYRLFEPRLARPGISRVLLLSIYVLAPLCVLLSGALASLPVAEAKPATVHFGGLEMVSIGHTAESAPRWPLVVLCTWIAGVVAVAAWFGWQRLRLRAIMRRCLLRRSGRATIALTAENGIGPFSFGRTVVIGCNDTSHSVLTHEFAHIRLLHRVDLAVARVYIMLMWFNPAAWLLADELAAVHEFQADKAVLSGGINARQYQILLIKKAVGSSFPAIANSLNHSNLKKRITMMQNSQNQKVRRWRSLALVPAMALAIGVFNVPAVATVFSSISSASIPAHKVSTFPANNNSENVKDNHSEQTETVIIARGTSDGDTESVSEGNFVVYLDGKRIPYSEMSKIGAEGIGSMTIYKGENAVERGAKPGQTVLIVTSKEAEPDQAPAASTTSDKQPAEFPGGEAAMIQWLTENTHFPTLPKEENAATPRSGNVMVSFVVGTDGSLSDVKIIRGVRPEFDKEALRVVKAMPHFIPGKENGKPVTNTFVLPISFKEQ